MKCLTSLALLLLCITISATAVRSNTSVSRTSIDGDLVFIACDNCVLRYTDVTWRPDPRGDKRDFRDGPAGPNLAAFNHTIQRPICWKLESGNVHGINWDEVRTILRDQYGADIGAMVPVAVTGVIEAPRCFSVTVDVFAGHRPEHYSIAQDGKSAQVIVFRPVDGNVMRYNNVTLLAYHQCIGSSEPAGGSGACASVSAVPFYGSCILNRPGDKRDFKDEPDIAPADPTSTWGKVKALYE